MQLRPYQSECKSIIDNITPGSYLVQMATGLGKTVTFTSLERRGRVLILSHREELVRQPLKYYDCTTGVEMAGESAPPDAEVVSASVQTLTRRLSRFAPDEFDMIITDECFPAGTLVDGRPIEDIKVGDYVNSYNHHTGRIEKKKVLHCFKNPAPEYLIEINGDLVCTENHPIYNLEKGAYQHARLLTPGSHLLYYVREGDEVERAVKREKGRLSTARPSILFGGLFKRIFTSRLVDNHVEDKQEICLREDEEKQSDEVCGISQKNVGNSTPHRSSPSGDYGEWLRAYGPAEKADERPDGTSPNSGIPSRRKRSKRVWLPRLLQNRYRDSRPEVGNRSRRRKSLLLEKKSGRREENRPLGIARVDSIKILEQRDLGRHRQLRADGYVYNIEVEGNNNYFAKGYLVHNCHHSAAQSYRRIYEHFTPRLHIGFTATPGRGDKVRLDDIFEDIIFQRDLRWGIENNYLSDIFCRRVNIGYDLSHVRTSHGDYAPGELAEAMDGTADAIAEAYKELATGATLIFAVSVKHAHEIASRIPGAAVVTGETKDRAAIVEAFTNGDIPVLVNCMVFTEGTDIPRVETIIIARPTQSDTLYAQMVGRGLRIFPGKEKLNLIDCVGITGKASLCTAPSLLGIDIKDIPPRKADEVQGMLFDLPTKAAAAADCPESWIKNVEIVNLWAKEQKYNTHDVSWFKMPDGSLVCSLPDKVTIKIGPQDELGRAEFNGVRMPMQAALDHALIYLQEYYQDCRAIWDLNAVKRWGSAPASEKQLEIIRRRCKGFDTTGLTKAQAGQILNRIIGSRRAG